MHKLACPKCHSQLTLENKTYRCTNNHCYDLSKTKYLNLLLNPDKSTNNPGDSKESLICRKNFLNQGYYDVILNEVIQCIKKYNPTPNDILDLGCGEGYYTNYLHYNLKQKANIFTVGVDISKYAIIEGCKKVKADKLNDIEYVIGNLMNLPFKNESFSFMLNCFALMDVKEFNRVLKENGYFIRVLPDSDHLLGIKEVLYKNVILNVMKEKDIEGFTLIDEIHIKEEIYDLFTMTPYYYKTSKESIEKLLKLDSLKTRVSFVLLVYQKKGN